MHEILCVCVYAINETHTVAGCIETKRVKKEREKERVRESRREQGKEYRERTENMLTYEKGKRTHKNTRESNRSTTATY